MSLERVRGSMVERVAALVVVWGLTACVWGQTDTKPVGPATSTSALPGVEKQKGTARPAGAGPASGKAGDQGGASKSAGADNGLETGPAAVPPGPTGRRRIGLALGGGGALAMSEIGALQWFEEHHIPVDMVAGTSMGSLVGALYATGRTTDEMKAVMDDKVFNQVFRIQTAYTNKSFRRREDSRDMPNAITVGLRNGVSLRNSVLTDQGLNSFLDREFLRYDDRTDFNTLPIPFRCLSTDLNEAKTVTFSKGSIPDAVRASLSIPGVYRPFELKGHEYVDGAVLENLPTQTIHDMKADVVLAVSLPLAPVGKNDLNSILGVLERSFGVAIEGNERASRKLADVVIEPDLQGFSAGDYLKTKELAQRGYDATEKHKAELMAYAVSDAEWAEYVANRTGRQRGPAGTLLEVRVKAPNAGVTGVVKARFAGLVNQPVDTGKIESVLADVRSDGRYDADYTVTIESGQERRPVLLVTVEEKKTGPPFVELGTNVQAQTDGTTRATIDATVLDQDLGGYGSELRSHVRLGYLTGLDTEYYRKLPPLAGIGNPARPGGFFVAPRLGLLREPFPIYVGNVRVAERSFQSFGGGADVGWSDERRTELRAGWEEKSIRWREQIGADGLPDVAGTAQRGRMKWAYDSQDRALVPRFGMHVVGEAGYLYRAAGSVSAPQFTTQFSLAHRFDKEIVVFGGDAGTMLNRNVGQPYRFTMGGPMRLGASGLDQYRGTDFFLIQPTILRKIASLPAVLGQSIYAGATYEAGQMRAPDMRTITRQDVFFGLVGETPLGVITIGPSIGDGGRYRLVFTLGRVF